MPNVLISGRAYAYVLQRQRRKTVEIRLTAADTLQIKAPKELPFDEIAEFLYRKSDWIRAKNALLKQMESSASPDSLISGASLPFMGKKVCLKIERNYCKPRVWLEGDCLVANLYLPNDAQLPDLLRRWYKRQAAAILQDKTNAWSKRIGVKVNRVSIKEQKTRWGSCSSLGNINYNWRIVMAPEETIDYLVVHETAHRVHLNHSKQFWELVGLHCPSYRLHRQWLRDNGAELFRVLRQSQL